MPHSLPATAFTIKGHHASTSECRKNIVVSRKGQKEGKGDKPEAEGEVGQYLDETGHNQRAVTSLSWKKQTLQ